MKTKSFILLLSSVFFASCGNPHLKELDLDRIGIPAIIAPKTVRDLKTPSIKADVGDSVVKITTKLPSEDRDIEIVSLDQSSDYILSYKLEIEKEFSIISSDCDENLSAFKPCSIKVNFKTDDIGVFKDNLIVSYKSKETNEEIKSMKVSLIGERLAEESVEKVEDLILKSVDGDDFVKIKTQDLSHSEELKVKNVNAKTKLYVSYSLEVGKYFELDENDCSGELSAANDCHPIVKLKADEPGSYKDFIIATYSSDKDGKDAKQVKIPVTAEIIATESTPLKSLVVKAKDGQDEINYKTLEDSLDVAVVGINPNDESLIIVSVSLEKNEHFSIQKNNCDKEISKKSVCNIEIKFDAEKEGKYTDNLVVVYGKKNSDEKYQVVTPIVVEKLQKIPTDLKVEILPNLGVNAVDFGVSKVDVPVSKLVVIKNKTVNKVKFLGSKITENGSFKLGKNGTCKLKEEISESCTLEVIFDSSSKGIKEGELAVTYSSVLGGKELVATSKLIGEKVVEEKELKPGKIEFSWKLSDDVDFKTVAVNSLHKATIQLFNTGEEDIELTSLNVKGKSFTLSHDCKKVLQAGSCNLEIGFLPLEEGDYEGELTVRAKNGQELKLKIKGQAENSKSCVKRYISIIPALPSYSLNKVILPYDNSKSGTDAKITNLYGTKVNNYIKSLNHYTVKDAQIISTFSFAGLKGKIVGIDIDLNVSKVVLDGYKDTEMFCLSSDSIQKCSGNDFKTSNFLSLKNEKFWKVHSKPVNASYEENLMNNISKCGSYDCSSFKGSMSIVKTLELSEKELASLKSEGIASIVITDDTKNISMPSLTITTEEVVDCKK